MSATQVAKLLRQRAKTSGLSHTQISETARITRTTWYRLLNAEIADPKLSTVIGVCDALKIDLSDIIQIYSGRYRILSA